MDVDDLLSHLHVFPSTSIRGADLNTPSNTDSDVLFDIDDNKSPADVLVPGSPSSLKHSCVVSYGVAVCRYFAPLVVEPTSDECADSIVSDGSEDFNLSVFHVSTTICTHVWVPLLMITPLPVTLQSPGCYWLSVQCCSIVSCHHSEFSSSNVDEKSMLSSSWLSFTGASCGVGEAVDPPDGLKDLICLYFLTVCLHVIC